MMNVQHIIVDTIDENIMEALIERFPCYIYSKHTRGVNIAHTHLLIKYRVNKNFNREIRSVIGDIQYKNYRIKTLEHFIRGFLYIRRHYIEEWRTV